MKMLLGLCPSSEHLSTCLSQNSSLGSVLICAELVWKLVKTSVFGLHFDNNYYE
uniref:Uncharacterized protein n=1 Tax=Arundo donax TaxID=35708 RepID=A0A0A9E8W0_ARUDO